MEYNDIVVWTQCKIVVEKLTRDRKFYEQAVQKIKYVFIYGVLPEIIQILYTRKPVEDCSGVVQTHPEMEQKIVQEPKTQKNCDVTVFSQIQLNWGALTILSVVSNGFTFIVYDFIVCTSSQMVLRMSQ